MAVRGEDSAAPPAGAAADEGAGPAWIDVTGAGAAGDGVTDDTAAVQNAIASLPPAGGTVFFPAGTYLVLQSQIVISASNVHVEGAPGAIIRGMNGAWASAKLVQIAGTPEQHITDITVTGLEFNGNQRNRVFEEATQAHLLEIMNADRVAVTKSFFRDSPGDAIAITTRTNVCRNITIHQNKIDTCLRNGISVVGGESIEIVGNSVLNFNTVGIDIEPDRDEPCRSIVVQSNTVRPDGVLRNPQNSNRLYGISVKSHTGPGENHSNVQVIGNAVEGVSEGEVRYPAAGIWLQKFQDCTIAFNRVIEARQGIMSSSESPATNGERGTIVGNVVRRSVNNGIGVHSNMTVSGNTVEDSQNAGIVLISINNSCIGNICRRNGRDPAAQQPFGIWTKSSSNLVQGNQCTDDQTVKTQQYGIYLDDGVAEVIVEFNRLEGNRDGGIRQPSQGLNTIRLNWGNTTQNSGTARIEPGRSYADVLHGLSWTPEAQSISLRALTQPARLTVSRTTAYSFTVTAEQVPSPSALDFSWEIKSAQ